MSRKAAKYREEAQKAFAKGKWEKALKAYVALTKLEPDEPKNHQKVAELTAKMGRKKDAVEKYKTALDLYMRKGFLIQAIALCKIVIQLDPGEKEMENKLAELYAKRGIPERPGAPGKPPPLPGRPPAASPRPAAPDSSQRPQPATPTPGTAPQPQPAEEPGEEVIDLVDTGGEEMAVERTSYAPAETATELPEEDLPEMLTDEGSLQEEEGAATGAPDDEEGIELEDAGGEEMEIDTAYGRETTTGEDAEQPEKVWDLSGDGEEEEAGVEIDLDEDELEEEKEEEVPVYDLSAELETGADLSSLEDEWEEEETPSSPPSETELLDESDFEEATFFPEIPLFSELNSEQFKEVVRHLQSRSFKKHDEVLREGDPGDSILIVASGRLEVYKETEIRGRVFLATLREGDFFGEFGYFAGSRRQASVVAAEDTEVLEITREDMEKVVKKFPGVEKVLENFYRTRVIENLLATSPLFVELDAGQRSYIASLFKLESFKENEDIIREGEEGDKMYLIRMGHVLVHTQNPMGEQIRLAELHPGDFFGEMSLLLGKPRTATVTATSPVVELMSLDKEDLDAIVSDYPAIGEKLQQVVEQRADDTVNKVSFLELDEEDLDIGSLL